MMVRYTPIKMSYYFRTHIWPWALVSCILSIWSAIDFTDSMDWADDDFQVFPIICIIWWSINFLVTIGGRIADTDLNHRYDYHLMLDNSKFNNMRGEKISAEAVDDEIIIYKNWHSLKYGKRKDMLQRFDVTDDLEATDKAIEFAAAARSGLNDKKKQLKAANKPNPEAASAAKVINKR